jgi:hypothetical protein
MRVSTALPVSVAVVDAVDYVAPLLSSYRKGYKSHSWIGKVLYAGYPCGAPLGTRSGACVKMPFSIDVMHR